MLATANPVEYEGTYPLPEAQLDRFLLRVSFGYPAAGEEWEVLRRRIERQQEAQTVAAVTDASGLLAMQRAVETVTVDEGIGRYCVRLAAATRAHSNLVLGASPRGSLALMLTSRAYAVIRGRDYVTPEDVKAVAHAALDHRVTVRPELWINDVTAGSVISSILSSIPTPSPSPSGSPGSTGLGVSQAATSAEPPEGSQLAARWRPTSSLVRSVVLGLTIVGIGMVLGRPDAVAIGGPLVIVAAWSILRRPAATPVAHCWLRHTVLREGQTTAWTLTVAPGPGVEDIGMAITETAFTRYTPTSLSVAVGDVGKVDDADAVGATRAARSALRDRLRANSTCSARAPDGACARSVQRRARWAARLAPSAGSPGLSRLPQCRPSLCQRRFRPGQRPRTLTVSSVGADLDARGTARRSPKSGPSASVTDCAESTGRCRSARVNST